MSGDKGEKSSWLEPIPEELAGDEEMTSRRMIIAGITVLVLAVFGGLIWYSYLEGTEDGPVPVVRANNSAVKVKPQEPGGMKVDHQDKEVFDRFSADNTAKEDTIAPSSEVALNRPEPEKPVVQPASDVKVALPPKPPVSDKKPAEVEKQVEKPVVEKKPEPKAMPAGDFMIQLGAFGSKTNAENLWKKLVSENKDVLSDLSPDYSMLDRGDKGILYRVRGGMITDRAEADNICAKLKSRKQNCIVIKP